MIRISRQDYRQKVLGCWLGKNIGGTLGAPFEGKRQINNVDFYTQKLGGEPLPNDDLDIQLLWLAAMEQRGIKVTAQTLSEYWCLFVTPHWNEYGTGKINLRSGLVAPLAGSFRNEYKHSCGSYIRSEIWACVAPGLPAVAAEYARRDACIDHGDGEGTYGEIFCASLESAAFVEKDVRRLIEIGLSYIPEDCALAKAVKMAVACHDKKMTPVAARDEILRNFMGTYWASCSDEDRKKGFDKGVFGFDAPLNVGLTIFALLHGGDDFGKVVCTATNTGEDTDCTAATAGAMWGLIHGAPAVPEKWITPIGHGIKTISLNLGDMGGWIPQTVDNLAERGERLANQFLLASFRGGSAKSGDVEFIEQGETTCDNPQGLFCPPVVKEALLQLRAAQYEFDFFRVAVDYGDEPVIQTGVAKKVRVTVRNMHNIQANLSLHWYLPEGWSVSPAADGLVQALPLHWRGHGPVELEFTFLAEKVAKGANRAVLELTAEGRPTVMLVPLVMLNGNIRV